MKASLSEAFHRLVSAFVVNYFSPLSGRRFDLEFQVGAQLLSRSLPSQVAVNGADAYVAAGEAGFGLFQPPYYHVAAQLKAGTLREVLGDWRPAPMPLTALYPPHRQLSRRVRVFVDWLVELFARQNLT